MTTVLLLLGGILVIGVALAAELIRLSSASAQSLNPVLWQRELAKPTIYEPMSRLFARDDFAFVAASPAGREINRRLRRSRSAVMTLYLRQMHADFRRVWVLCRLLAPFATDSELSILLLRQFVMFHGLYFLVRLRCWTGWYGSADFDVSLMLRALSQIRSSASLALQSSQFLAAEPVAF